MLPFFMVSSMVLLLPNNVSTIMTLMLCFIPLIMLPLLLPHGASTSVPHSPSSYVCASAVAFPFALPVHVPLPLPLPLPH